MTAAPVPFGEAVRVWAKVAALSFGGPAGQIAVMHRLLVEERRWVSEARFLHALNFCMLLPGPEAQQLATYLGWLLHRARGGLVAGVLFVLPGFVAILALSLLYVTWRDAPAVAALFYGVKPAVIAIVAEACVRIGKRVLHTAFAFALAAAAFGALAFLDAPFPAVVLAAGLIGLAVGRWRPRLLPVAAPDDVTPEARPRAPLARAVRIVALCGVLWIAPILGAAACLGGGHVLVQEGLFFSKAAVVTFGGAYAALAYVQQAAVETFGWLTVGEMQDGLALAETTPGPLIMVLQFVGFLGAYRAPGPLDPMVAALLGSLMTTWVTFVPCFLWIFLGAPYVEALRGKRSLAAALAAITAAATGVILHLAMRLAEHTWLPGGTLDVVASALTLGSLVALLVFRIGMLPVLGASALLGGLWHLLA